MWYLYFEIFDFVLDKEFRIQSNCKMLSLTVCCMPLTHTPNKKVSFHPNHDT